MKAPASITLFGIPNCDTVKKARTWLEQQAIPFDFHNFKKEGLSAEQVELWLKKIDFDTLINRKGTSWRALSEEQKNQAASKAGALALVLENPSLIKRPVLQIGDNTLDYVGVGFSDQLYSSIFQEK
ncbi:arsenate reductase [Undibacterium danionis]|uniref:Arsenate reductase n=1 Tax=Undibacterium danionis TaxID=1812100 RepID=A0ABV6I9S0_9BURK